MKGRVHFGLVTSNQRPDYWQLKVSESHAAGHIVRITLTQEQFSALMSGAMVTDVDLEVAP